LGGWLGEGINQPTRYIFSEDGGITPDSTETIYRSVRRRLEKSGLLYKLDPNSRINALHPHSFRKLFFTRCLGVGIDRGLVEQWMGHKFGLDGSYLRMSEEAVAEHGGGLLVGRVGFEPTITGAQDQYLDQAVPTFGWSGPPPLVA
jgi:hypothetical protein